MLVHFVEQIQGKLKKPVGHQPHQILFHLPAIFQQKEDDKRDNHQVGHKGDDVQQIIKQFVAKFHRCLVNAVHQVQILYAQKTQLVFQHGFQIANNHFRLSAFYPPLDGMHFRRYQRQKQQHEDDRQQQYAAEDNGSGRSTAHAPGFQKRCQGFQNVGQQGSDNHQSHQFPNGNQKDYQQRSSGNKKE